MISGDIFPMHPGLLKAVAREMSVRQGFYPSTDIAGLLAAHRWAHRAPWSRKGWDDRRLEVNKVKKTDLLTTLRRCRHSCRADDFSSAAWKSADRMVKRLSDRQITVRTLEFRGGRKIEVEDSQPLLFLEAGKLSLWHAVPPDSRYFVLVSSAFFEIASSLGHDASRLFCWLSYRHRGSKKAGTLYARWEVELTCSLAIDFGLDARSDKKAWLRLVGAAELLRSLGVVDLTMFEGARDRMVVQLNPAFFVSEEVAG